MRRILSIALLAAFALPARAEDQPKPPTAKIEVSEQDVRVLSAALDIAAAACPTNVTGCQVGELKGPLIEKLNAALVEIQRTPPK